MNKSFAAKKILSTGPLALALLFCAVTLFGSRQPATAAASGSRKAAPAWELKDVDGKKVKSSDFKGKVVILDFWATWCGPCRAEIPSFIELHKQYEKDGLVVIGVSLDDGSKPVKKFIASEKINYPIVMGNDSVTGDFGGVEVIPTTFVIDRDGKIVSKHVGVTQKAEFEAEIKPLLAAGK
ncbi:MAG TPA: redoxin domain-containing protein [Verrucomicrobiae bacterium]|nr:redoxin domain-containing protein [Verrucomicrobiae bacterium]